MSTWRNTSGLLSCLTAFLSASIKKPPDFAIDLQQPPPFRVLPLLPFFLLGQLGIDHGRGTEEAARAAHGRYVPWESCPFYPICNLPQFLGPELTTILPLADQLIGTGAQGRNAQLSITDPKVCRSYLVGTCPHDLFTNTKQDLGPCPKVHSEGLKTEYETASSAEKAKWGFEFDYLRDMQKYIDDCDRRIETAQRRLEKTPDEIRQTNALVRPGLQYASLLLYVNLPRYSLNKLPTSPTPSTAVFSKCLSSAKQAPSQWP